MKVNLEVIGNLSDFGKSALSLCVTLRLFCAFDMRFFGFDVFFPRVYSLSEFDSIIGYSLWITAIYELEESLL